MADHETDQNAIVLTGNDTGEMRWTLPEDIRGRGAEKWAEAIIQYVAGLLVVIVRNVPPSSHAEASNAIFDGIKQGMGRLSDSLRRKSAAFRALGDSRPFKPGQD